MTSTDKQSDLERLLETIDKQLLLNLLDSLIEEQRIEQHTSNSDQG